MKSLIIALVVLCFACKSNTSDISKIENPKLEIKKPTDSITRTLPIGISKLMDKDFKLDTNDDEGSKEYKSIFDFYDTLLKSDSTKLYNKYSTLSYIPDKSFIQEKDKHPLLGDEENQTDLKTKPFNIVKILPKSGDFNVVIVSGTTPYNEYHSINRMELLTLNNELEIIDEFNIYYAYASEISTKQKFFFIDKSYNIFIRYYFEKEEKPSYFSEVKKYKLSPNGKIINQ
ncbi:hypothetical protein [Lacinutrix mariniflava]|uniref:hypothetical protein n=1 Tax=Lacinutrix mariniflava TaxID=342955 RepID=UPI0006E4308E|nr:hypothetical protein [Lacinutrix mariniflava]